MKTRHGLALVLAVALCCALPVSALAYARIDTAKSVSLTLEYRYTEAALVGVSVRVYRVADVSEDARFTLAGAFADDPVKVDGLTQSGQWNSAAQTLAGYAVADAREATASGKSGEDGKLAFPKLKLGLYLVVADPLADDPYLYTFSPFLLCLPDGNGKGEWTYAVEAKPKCERGDAPKGLAQYRVVKYWANSEADAQRPQNVTVEIYRGDARCGTQILSEDNNWTYEWQAENDASVWRVVERSTDTRYTVTVTQAQAVFTVTNTFRSDEPDEPSEPKPPSLPQTGQLWWPVPLLAAAGLLLFVIGWTKANRGKKT